VHAICWRLRVGLPGELENQFLAQYEERFMKDISIPASYVGLVEKEKLTPRR
jgi:hypothetical protein